MKKIFCLVLAAITILALSSVPVSSHVNTKYSDETIIGADFSSGEFAYQLSKKFDKDPNTIEAWVRLGKLAKNEAGGVIFSNYEYYNYHAVKLEIDENRHVSFNWNASQVVATFEEYALAVDKWTHISVVRDEENYAFNLYVNGKLTQTINAYTGTSALADYRYIVGGDWSNWRATKKPFQGEIGQITAYSKALNSKEIYEDYLFSDEITSSTRSGLLFNGEFTFGCMGSTDTSGNLNHATLRSNDYFYNGELYEAKDYTFAIIPDPQIMSHWRQENLDTISKYIIDYNNKYSNGGINKVALTLCVGDNGDGVSSDYPQFTMDYQLAAIKDEYTKLANAGIRWVTTPGNHDYDDNCTETRNLDYYNKYFRYDEISRYDYFGGVYQIGQTQNAYYLFEECGVPYLVISIEFGADDSVLEWANNVVASYPERRVIVDTHAYIGGDGEIISASKAHGPKSYSFNGKVGVNNPDDIFEKFIKKHENIFMVFCGHVPVDDIFLKESVGEHGNVIMQFLIDAQGVLDGGAESILSMITFDELNQTISVNYVSTTINMLYNVQNQFTWSFKGHTNILSSIYYDENGNLKPEYK